MPYRDPERQRRAKAESARRSRRRRSTLGVVPTESVTGPLLPVPVRLKAVSDALNVLEGQVSIVKSAQGVNVLDRARCIGYLIGIALRAISADTIESRLAAIEGVIGCQT